MTEQQNKKTLSPLVAVVDIETASTRVDAVIATIGCVVIDVFTGEELGAFYRRCNYLDQEATRHTCEDTLKWWKTIGQESPEAHYEATSYDCPDRLPLPEALIQLNAFLVELADGQRLQVIGNGPEFDNAILLHAMKQHEIKPAWSFWCNQSLRTAVWLGRLLLDYDPKYELAFEGTKHHALNDARHEAKYLHLVIKKFQEKLGLNKESPVAEPLAKNTHPMPATS